MTNARFWIVFFILFGVVAGLAYSIFTSDRYWLAESCTKSSAALEWVASPSQAEQIIDDWRHVKGAVQGVTYGILLDFLFIGAYVALGLWTLKRCKTAVPEISWWQGTGRKFELWLVLAGAFDVIENIGILLELHASAYRLAWVTALFAWMKWIVAGLVVVYVVFTAVLCLRRWDAKTDEDRAELLRLESSGSPSRSQRAHDLIRQ